MFHTLPWLVTEVPTIILVLTVVGGDVKGKLDVKL